nr:hypothetical protein [Tanacetum cinerariifolium]
MSSASSAVTYTSVYTYSELGRVLWGADEELSNGGSPRVIVYGYNGLPMLPVAPPSPDYTQGFEEPQTPPATQDEDEHKLVFIQPHDPDFDEDEEEDEEHLAPTNSTVVTFISLPPEAKVERLLAMPTPSPSPLNSLSPPSAGERLARCTAPAALPSALLPPSLYPPHVDRRDGILESKQSPRKRICLSTLSSRYEVGESSTRGRGVDYGFFNTIKAEIRHRGIREVGYGISDAWIDPAKAVPEMAPTTLEGVNTKVTKLAELHEHDTHDLYALLKDAQDGRTRIS